MKRSSVVMLVVAGFAFASVAVSGPYDTSVLRDNPLVYWHFDEAGGNAINQADPGDPNDALAPQGGATRVTHTAIASGLPLGNAADFSGANGNRFYAPDIDGPAASGGLDFVPTQLWALETWFQIQGPNPPGTSRGDYLLEVIGPSGVTNNPGIIYDFNYGAGDQNKLELYRGNRTAGQGPTLNDTEWHHAVFAFYGNTGGFGIVDRQDFWIDGKLVASATGTNFSSGFGLVQLALGNTVAAGGVNGFQSRMDEVALYDIGAQIAVPLSDPTAQQRFADRLADLAARARSFELYAVPVASYSYIGLQPHPSYQDTGTAELTDGVVGTGAWNDPAWVGIRDPLGLHRDDGQPQPLIEFDLGTILALDAVTIDYLVDHDGGIYAPDLVTLLASADGLSYTQVAVNMGFDDSADPAGAVNGAVRSLTIDFPDVNARFMRLDFRNDDEWTFLSEVTFQQIPEPATLLLLAAGALGLVARRRC